MHMARMIPRRASMSCRSCSLGGAGWTTMTACVVVVVWSSIPFTDLQETELAGSPLGTPDSQASECNSTNHSNSSNAVRSSLGSRLSHPGGVIRSHSSTRCHDEGTSCSNLGAVFTSNVQRVWEHGFLSRLRWKAQRLEAVSGGQKIAKQKSDRGRKSSSQEDHQPRYLK